MSPVLSTPSSPQGFVQLFASPKDLEFALRSVSLTLTSEVRLLAPTPTPPHSDDFSVLQFEPRSLEQQEQQEGTRPISTSGAPEFGNQASEIMLHEVGIL
ncbi:hypothetical protein NL676_004555 [Syzygium grande]|nr:hypothetical protein NL676_004555 [Syzygium grande]